MSSNAESSRGEEIRFLSEGISCAGTLFRPPAPLKNGAPGVLMAHGFAAVRGMSNIPEVVKRLLAAGIAALTIDYRFLGDSDGEPRQTVSPFCQRQDLQNALSWLGAQAGIDEDRLGLWGTSFSGGQVLQVAAFDRRVKAVVAQVPATDLYRQIRSAPAGYRNMLAAQIADERQRQFRGAPAGVMKLAAPEGELSLFGVGSLDWTSRNAAQHGTFRNAVAIGSLNEIIQSDPADYIEAISPTPLLMIAANQDRTVAPEITRQSFERAGQPKKLVTYEGTHYAVYDDPAIAGMASKAAAEWYQEYL